MKRRSSFVDKGQAEVKNRRCLNPACTFQGIVGSGNIVRHGFYRTRVGKRRRYRCLGCSKTLSSTKGTPYYRLQHRRTTFDAVVTLRVEGVSISAIARVEGIAWNTVARWLEKAADACRCFNHARITGFTIEELQADEIRSFVGSRKRPCWIFAAIEVGSRLWPSTVVGRRSYRNTLALMRDVANGMDFRGVPLIVTDGSNDSEDSSTLNTSFIERLNLTIRQSLAYLSRRTLSHARSKETLEDHLELVCCHYNFVRPHRALRFGWETRTPAMQAGLTTRRLTFREVFVCTLTLLLMEIVTIAFRGSRTRATDTNVQTALAA